MFAGGNLDVIYVNSLGYGVPVGSLCGSSLRSVEIRCRLVLDYSVLPLIVSISFYTLGSVRWIWWDPSVELIC